MIEDRPAFVSKLLTWWPEASRDLPWRNTRDPWLILLSEVMSQQTQVDRVMPKWKAFVERFPTPSDAAAVAAGELIAMWVGLGYNRRALMLHRCATEIDQRHGGRVPDKLDELLALSGIGPYTARAVLAFAFEQDVAVLDTNVGRVLARLNGRSFSNAEAQCQADALVPVGRGWDWNQTILDFGATVCKKRNPACGGCPVRELCVWAGQGADPAVGSAAVTIPQSRFEGSDRQARSRVVALLGEGPVSLVEARAALGFGDDSSRIDKVMASLVDDGLAILNGETVRLP